MIEILIDDNESGLIVLKEMQDLENVFKIHPVKKAKKYIITNDKRKETVEKCIRLRCDYYFLKPLSVEILKMIKIQIKKHKIIKK